MSGTGFTDAEIGERFCHIFQMADAFCHSLNQGSKLQAEIDPALLYLAVVAIYDDIARYKSYHLADPLKQRANAIKRVAYATKWLTHFAPIYFPDASLLKNNGASHDGLVNAQFALHYAMSNLQIFTSQKCALNPKLVYHLIYDLLYRNISSDALILFFDMIADLAKGAVLVT